eukprot:g16186.t1
MFALTYCLEAVGVFREKPLITWLARRCPRRASPGEKLCEGSTTSDEDVSFIPPLRMSVPEYKLEENTGFYKVTLSRGKSGEALYSVWKRYSEFRELRERLGTKSFPDFPSKKIVFLSKNKKTLEKRRKQLERFLRCVEFAKHLSALNRWFGFYDEYCLTLEDVRGIGREGDHDREESDLPGSGDEDESASSSASEVDASRGGEGGSPSPKKSSAARSRSRGPPPPPRRGPTAVATAARHFREFADAGEQRVTAEQLLQCLRSHSAVMSGWGPAMEAVKKDLDGNIRRVATGFDAILKDAAALAEVLEMMASSGGTRKHGEEDTGGGGRDVSKDGTKDKSTSSSHDPPSAATAQSAPTSSSTTSSPSLQAMLAFEARKPPRDGGATDGALWSVRGLELALSLIGGCLEHVQKSHPEACKGLALELPLRVDAPVSGSSSAGSNHNKPPTTTSSQAQQQDPPLLPKADAVPLFRNLPISEVGRAAYCNSVLINIHGSAIRMMIKMGMSGLPSGPTFFERIDFATLDELFAYVAEGRRFLKALPSQVYS